MKDGSSSAHGALNTPEKLRKPGLVLESNNAGNQEDHTNCCSEPTRTILFLTILGYVWDHAGPRIQTITVSQ